jgi:Ca2+-binding RTX toxin-like protein
MATFTAFQASDDSVLTEIFALANGTPETASPTEATFTWSPALGFDAGRSVLLAIDGTGMNGPPSDWTIGAITATIDGHTAWTITGLDLNGADLETALTFGNPGRALFPGDDTIIGSPGNDYLAGFTGNDLVIGGAGNDKLGGSKGLDTLVGGPGRDSFFIDQPLDGTNLAFITDFRPAVDKIDLYYQVFRATAGFGPLPASEFHVGSHAITAAERILYDPATGHLLYDSNGSHPGGVHLFAILHPHLALTAGDFLVT